MHKFEEYCIPKCNVTYERHRFFTCVPKPKESIDQYITKLRTIAKTCDFGTLCDSLIKDRIVCGTGDNALRARLLRESNLTLETAIQMCRAAEATRSQVQGLTTSEPAKVDVVRRQAGARSRDQKATDTYADNRQNQQNDKKKTGNKGKKQCGNYATRHPFGAYSAHGKTCNNCDKLNHYARCCRSTLVKQRVKVVENSGYSNDTTGNQTEEFFIDSLEQGISTDTEGWIQAITVNNREINFKLDTGAKINIPPASEFDKLQPKPHSAGVKVIAYAGGTPIPVIGRCVTTVHYKAKTHFIHFIIVPKNVQPLLGVKTCEKLGIVKRVYQVQTNESSCHFMSGYHKLKRRVR